MSVAHTEAAAVAGAATGGARGTETGRERALGVEAARRWSGSAAG